MLKNELTYRLEKEIPYYDQRHSRTFFQIIRKIKNTLLLLLAYSCPSAKLRILLHRLRGVNIGKGCYIGMFCFIDNLYPEYIYIEDGSSINTGVMLIAHFNPLISFKGILEARVSPVIIKRGALIAVKSIILPGVIVGDYAIVSAGSVVSEDVEPRTLVRGNPAKKTGKVRINL